MIRWRDGDEMERFALEFNGRLDMGSCRVAGCSPSLFFTFI
jgi:hypothetical protein